MKATLIPYLLFNGNTAEAMHFYKSVLGGELTMQTFEESGMPCTPENRNYIIHADLKNDTLSFMASDGDSEHPVHMGDNIQMSIVGSEEPLLTAIFKGLSEGGKIVLPLGKQFWGDVYGQFTDKFGVHWSINIMGAAAQAEV